MTFVSTPKNLLANQQRFPPGVSTKKYLNRLGNNNRFFNRQVTKDQQKMRIEVRDPTHNFQSNILGPFGIF